MFNQGYILAAAYKDEREIYVDATEVVERDGGLFYGDVPVTREWGKMGKSLKNAVTPDDICGSYGADTLRLYEMAMGPLDASRPWETRDVVGMYRFLQRLWRNIVDEETGEVALLDTPADDETRALLHRTISGVRDDMDALALQHGDRQADRVQQPPHQVGRVPGRGCRAAGADGRSAGAAHAPRSCGRSSATTNRWHTSHSPSPTRRCWSPTPSSIRCRSTARFAATSRSPPTSTPPTSRRPRWPTPRSSHYLDGATPKKVIVVTGRMVNIVV